MHKKGISLNSVEKSLSHSADKIRSRTLLCFERILVSKIFKQRRGKLHDFVEIFFISQDRKTSPGNHSVFQKISGREKIFMDKRGVEEVSRFSVEKFLSHCTKIFHWRALWCFRKFFYRKFSCIGGFCRKFLSQRTETKSFVKEPLFSRKFLVSKKNLWIRGGKSRFSVDIFMPHSAEKFCGHPFNVSENLGYRKNLCIIEGITFFRRKFLVSQCRKIS